MRKLAAAIVAAMLLMPARAALAEPGRSSPPTLDTRIGFADPSRWKGACSEQEWHNPLIVVNGDALQLKSLSHPQPRTIKAADLRRALTALPIGDWPYGRIVAIPNRSVATVEAARETPSSLRVGWWMPRPDCASTH